MSAGAQASPPGVLAVILHTSVLAAAALPLEPAPLKYGVWTLGLGTLGLAAAASGRVGRIDRTVAAVFAGWLSWFLLAWAFARSQDTALLALAWVAALVAYALFAARHAAAAPALACRVLVLLGLASSGWALLQSAGLLAHDHWANPVRNSGFWTNSNLFAAHLVIGLLAAAGLLLSAQPLGWRLLAGLEILAGSLALALTGSRGGWLAAACGLGLMLAAMLRRGRRRRLLALLLPVAAVLGGLVWLLRSGGLDGVRERLELAGDYSVGHRLLIWGDALGMLRAHPVLGVGPGGFADAFPRFRSFSDRFSVNFAHSDWLEAALTLGLPGLLLSLALLLGVAGAGRRRWSAAAPGDKPLVLGLGAVLLALAVQSLYDFPTRPVLTGLETALVVGCLVGVGPAARWNRDRLQAGLLAGAALVVGGAETRAAWLAQRAEQLRLAGRLAQAAALSERAATMPGSAPRAVRAGMLLVLSGDEERLAGADLWFERALEYDPDSADAWLGRALVARRLGRADRALGAYRAAVAAAPMDAGYQEWLYRYLLSQDRLDEASRVLAGALGLAPYWATARPLMEHARELGLSDQQLLELLPPRSPAVRRALPELVRAGRLEAARGLIERDAARLTRRDAHDLVGELERLGRPQLAAALTRQREPAE